MTLPDKPLVPPPPVLGGEGIGSATPPVPRATGTATPGREVSTDAEEKPAQTDEVAEANAEAKAAGDEEENFGSLIDVLHAQLGRTDEVPAPIAASRRRKGALPPPKAEATRASYSSARSSGKPPPAPGVNALPSGVRPPGVPDAVGPDDTGVLIASAVAALTSDENVEATPSAEAEAAAATATKGAAASSAVLTAAATEPTAAAPSASPAGPGTNKAVWMGAAAVLGIAAVWWLWPSSGGSSPPPGPVTRAAVAQHGGADQDARRGPMPAANIPKLDPQGEPGVDDPPLDVEPGAEPEPGPTGGDAMGDGELGADEAGGGELEVDPDAAVDMDADMPSGDSTALEETPPSESAKPRARKKKKSHKKASATPTSSAPATDAAPAKNGAALLADAKAALTAGQLQSAYRLASQARGKGQRSGTLVIMAKAACRMGSETKAKKAFGKMSISERRGIRSECRAKGIRLGL